MKKIAFVTLFPDWVRSSLSHSIVARAESSGAVEFSVVNPRNFCYDQHRKVDDIPYGGHPGMLLKAEPVALAIESLVGSWESAVGSLQSADREPSPIPPNGDRLTRFAGALSTESVPLGHPVQQTLSPSEEVSSPIQSLEPEEQSAYISDEPREQKLKIAVVITEPSGTKFEQPQAEELASYDQVIFVCGHYEGIDHRIEETFATHVVSIGDYVLTNGELPALVMADAVVRLLPGVLGNQSSLEEESFQNNLLGAPNYTRPEVWRGIPIPDVLKSGNHGLIDKWRHQQAVERTKVRRPDLLDE